MHLCRGGPTQIKWLTAVLFCFKPVWCIGLKSVFHRFYVFKSAPLFTLPCHISPLLKKQTKSPQIPPKTSKQTGKQPILEARDGTERPGRQEAKHDYEVVLSG